MISRRIRTFCHQPSPWRQPCQQSCWSWRCFTLSDCCWNCCSDRGRKTSRGMKPLWFGNQKCFRSDENSGDFLSNMLRLESDLRVGIRSFSISTALVQHRRVGSKHHAVDLTPWPRANLSWPHKSGPRSWHFRTTSNPAGMHGAYGCSRCLRWGYTPEKVRKRSLKMVVLNRNLSFSKCLYVSGAMLAFGGVNWFLSLEDEQVSLSED